MRAKRQGYFVATTTVTKGGGTTALTRGLLVSTSVLLGLVIMLSGCKRGEEAKAVAEPIRPVRVVTVEEHTGGETATLTGTIQAEEDVALSFRIGGQLVQRLVNVGDTVTTGQLVARIDDSTWRDSLQAARANLAAAMARLVEARTAVERLQPVLPQGFVSRQMFDRAAAARDAAQAQVDAAEAQVSTAETQLSYTELFADGPGVVTARGAESGEVINAGQMIVRLARKGGRDAVFDVPGRLKDEIPGDAEIEVSLSSDPKVLAVGRVREVSPEADPMTRTFKFRVGLSDPPAAMRLGSTVTGTIQIGGGTGMTVPASALTASEGKPAVWVVNPADETVSLRNVDVVRYDLDRVLIAHGLSAGELVVTAGVQVLRPGQKVRLLGTTP
jgi:RND family efflux transporter MFP subunit